ncbi:MAG: hypothetical protein CMJ31_12570 [Phycisphaerae bacterium]|nr:hypothetical protein [Phycisphaerae bacterium]
MWVGVAGAAVVGVGLGAAIIVHSLGFVRYSSGVEGGLILTFGSLFAFGPPLVAAIYLGPVRRNLARSVLRARLRLCVFCGHDLSGRAHDEQRCPECGRILTTREAVRYWRRFLRGGDRRE